jgi:hypothetical protein
VSLHLRLAPAHGKKRKPLLSGLLLNYLPLLPIRAFERLRSAQLQEDAMSVVIAYRILEATTREAMEEAVRESLSKGWQPLGGLTIAAGVFYQTMVGS